MAGTVQTFLRLVSGVATTVKSTWQGGTANANTLLQTDANGLLDTSLFPAGIGQDQMSVVASEALTAGQFVNLWANAGVINARKADGSVAGKRAHGFVLAAVASGGTATIYRSGQNTQQTGLTVGDQWLSTTTPGGAQATPPAEGSGYVSQMVGTALTTTNVDVLLGTPYQLS